MNRRNFIMTSAAAAAVSQVSVGSAPQSAPSGDAVAAASTSAPKTGRLRPSVCRWCYGGIPLAVLCEQVKPMGIESIELLGENDWAVVRDAGLRCAVANGPTAITNGLNNSDNHPRFAIECERLLPLVRAAGIPNMIVFSGNRGEVSDEQGLANCAAGLQLVTQMAEDQGVTIVMELLNSKIDHRRYMCDHTAWGVELVKRVASDRFRLLYDIYHMQIMEGDVIRTVTDNIEHIAHFHTGGVPGRAELNESQELFYPAICTAIADAGYSGYLGQEFIPRGDPMSSLADAVRRCTV